ncbi:chondroitin sulfate proteoglycan 5 isoform X2 [Pipistrellus kuhlii]|uniref:chondroitin sulfate proteoglycan 5 isoform X1 n=1 Tax=Pipistrellus kuhlii TaxID=59472 RepID=UPI001E27003D|nr:chondroitin sulfate proteoglycan 5 isoform X1 [Pipistrellus kuhlii]XP_045434728.1 chondroitin sulfate proteoglycan 5 isoform X2 [Pipistrellus kuhlii]
MGRAGAGGPGRGPPLLLLAAALVLAGAAPAREAGSAVAVDVDEPAPTTPAWEPRANATRAPAGPPGAGAAEAWTAEAAGGPGAGPEDALEASAVTGTAWEADGPGLGAGPAEAGSGDTQAPPATPRAPAPAPAPRRTRAAETPSWSLLDLYDDFTPFDESDFYPTTSFYDDLDEDGDGDGEGGPAPGPGTGPPPGWWHAVPPRPPGPAPGGGIALRPRPGEPARDPAAGENGTACRSGFVRHNSSCRSVCDLLPSYCHNGGQCYQVEGIGALCRCNTQDYIWHKGTRCESVITDFQVMCVAVGAAALVLLLLFMMTVFFAKKLYLLRTENTKLRRTHKFRTPSELHNDNFSLSTIAEGSHPNDDPSAPHKIQEVLKSCLKEEEPFLAQNSLSPKLEGGRRDPAQLEPNCLQNNLT